jgi:S-methylmethionine-dependent homocysteine/selenocysteine methylase
VLNNILIEKYDELNRPLILDGAVGSNLQHLNNNSKDSLWTSKFNFNHPDEVTKLHKEYLEAGADIITTNTFRSNPAAFKKASLPFTNEDIIKAGVESALKARGNKDIIIAGSNPPAEDCYQIKRTIGKIELESNHKFHIGRLWAYGCDIIWNETFSHLDEIVIVCQYCSSNKIPFTINLFFDEELNLLSGELLIEIIEIVESYNPAAIGFNCIKPKLLNKLFESYSPAFNWGFYLNCGSGNTYDKEIYCDIEPENYRQIVKMYIKYNPLFIGSCCGSGPKHTQLIKEMFSEIY